MAVEALRSEYLPEEAPKLEVLYAVARILEDGAERPWWRSSLEGSRYALALVGAASAILYRVITKQTAVMLSELVLWAVPYLGTLSLWISVLTIGLSVGGFISLVLRGGRRRAE